LLYQNDKTQEEIYDQLFESFPDKTYIKRYDVKRNYIYFKFRDTILRDVDGINVNTDDKGSRYNIISACGIDQFMNSFHLLDFWPVYYDNTGTNLFKIFRSKFIVKRNYGYVIVSLSEDEAINKSSKYTLTDINESIFMTIPNTLDEYKKSIKNDDHYELLIEGNPLLKYIKTVEDIRERLLITVVNYMYDYIKIAKQQKNIIEMDPTHILVNVYEGDIDKILTVT